LYPCKVAKCLIGGGYGKTFGKNYGALLFCALNGQEANVSLGAPHAVLFTLFVSLCVL
jgi:hypothetical protein